MRLKTLGLVLLLSVYNSTGLAEDRPPLVVPPGAQISLAPFKQKWLLGENILLYYEVKNTGTEAFEVDHGGDYRGGTRAGRFKVLACDEAGALQEDPNTFQLEMGGMGGTGKVEPGKSWFGNVALMSYRNLASPGKYTIRVAHDLGWRGEPLKTDGPSANAPLDPRWAETTIEVAMPTDEQAKQILVELMEAKDPGWTAGVKHNPRPSLNCLRYPIYLPYLMKLSRAHHHEGVNAIASQMTPEATSALTELLFLADDAGARHGNSELMNQRGLGHVEENETISDAAARFLTQRVPAPALAAGDKQAAGWDESYRQQRLKRIADCWRQQHVEPVRKYARNVLLNEQSQGLRDSRKENAVAMLQGVATPEDQEVFVKAMNDALQVSHVVFDQFPESVQAKESPLHYGILFDLERCLKVMQLEPNQKPETPGEIVVYLTALQQPEAKIPAEFEPLGLKWLNHEISYLRRLTLEALPRPIPAWAKPEFAKLLSHVNVGVRYESARAIKDSEDEQFRDVVLKRIAVEKDEWVMAELDSAAQEVGVPRDVLLEAWAKRLGEDVYDRGHQRFATGAKSFNLLTDNAFGPSGGSWNATDDGKGSDRVSKRWLAFIQTHRKEILAGKVYKIGDPEMTEDLFLEGATIRQDEKEFPPRPTE